MIKIRKKRFVIILICTALISVLLAGGVLMALTEFGNVSVVKKSEYEQYRNISERYSKLYSIQNVIDNQFLWNVDEEEIMDNIYRTLMDSLGDKYSSYMNKEEFEAFTNYVTGNFTGVGIVFTTDTKGNYIITQIIKDGPADLAGLKVHDILLKVDGKTYDDSTSMAEAMRGEAGTEVKITYERNKKEKDVTLIRATVEAPSVYSEMLDDEIGYIGITAFEKTTGSQFAEEVKKLEKQKAKGMIVDLRNNPGGLVDQGISVADTLLPDCTITHTEDKNGKKEYYNSNADCTRLKYVLLVNENTASASEIIAAAVKDNGGGKIVGTNTYGKGIIQGTATFNDGSAVKLTIMQYFSPNGDEIHKIGIKPDYEVKLPEDLSRDIQLEKAIKILKQDS